MNTRSLTKAPGLPPKSDPPSLVVPPHVVRWERSRAHRFVAALRDDSGAATAEYAMVVLAAVGLGGLLAVILKSDDVRSLLMDLISRALTGA